MNTETFTNWVGANFKIIIAGFVAIALAAGLWGLMRSQGMAKERKAANALYDATQKANTLVNEKKFAEAVAVYKELAASFPKTRAGFDAVLRMGDIWSDSGNLEEAIKQYEEAIKTAPDAFSRSLAEYNVGVAYENSGKYAEAAAKYESAMKASEAMKPELLLAQARCYEKLGQKPKALELYKTLQEKFANKGYYSGAAAASAARLMMAQ